MKNLEFFFDTKLFHVRAEWPAVCVQEATAYSFANCIQMGRKGPAQIDRAESSCELNEVAEPVRTGCEVIYRFHRGATQSSRAFWIPHNKYLSRGMVVWLLSYDQKLPFPPLSSYFYI